MHQFLFFILISLTVFVSDSESKDDLIAHVTLAVDVSKPKSSLVGLISENLNPSSKRTQTAELFDVGKPIPCFFLVMLILWSLWRYTVNRITVKHNLQLENLERQRSEELHQQKLQFFTNISNELRNPLKSITGPLEDLLKKDDNVDRREHYKLIHKCSSDLLHLINNSDSFQSNNLPSLEPSENKKCPSSDSEVEIIKGEGLPLLLIVDDDSDIRNFIRTGVENDYRIVEAENGNFGYERALELLPDLVISDIAMPEMDGFMLLNKLKSDKRTSHIPVLLLTAKSMARSEFEGMQIGADGYVAKPFRIDMLESRINNIISHREQLRKRFALDIALEPTDITVTSADERFIMQAVEIVEAHMTDSEFTVTEFVKEMGLSRSNLYYKFKELTGLSTGEFIRNIRLKRAINLVEKGDFLIKEVMHKTGFSSASYFTKCFKKQFGFTPSEYESVSDADKKIGWKFTEAYLN